MKRIALLLLFIAPVILAEGQTVNEKIIDYCKKQMGKTVDRGECWDLIKFALDAAGAKWNNFDVYGTVYDYKKETIKAGDVIEFADVKFEYPDGHWFTMGSHFAIVYEVKDKNNIVIVHQNHNGVRKVQTLDLDLSMKKKGKMTFYRVGE